MRLSCCVRCILLAVAALATPAAYGQTTVAGTIEGEFSTDTRGAATYTINLPSPPGTGGIEPGLTLAYNNAAGNGLLGVGWTLTGMSSIARCAPIFAVDHYRAPVTYTNRDRLCLDGAELIAVNGVYWAPGTIYHTELESWIPVTAQADGSFLARTPEGKAAIYGGNVQSRIMAPGVGQTRIWAMSSIADRFGNTMTFSYENNPGDTGQYYPTTIDYTSNKAHPIRYGRRVRFIYDQGRMDSVTQYIGGSPLRLTARLTTISTYLVNPSETLVSRFNLTYQYSSTTFRSLLASIRQCDATDHCYPETKLTPQAGSNTLRSAQLIGQMSFGTTDNVKFSWGDFTGQGRKDLLAYNDGPPNNVWVVPLQADGNLAPNPINLGANPCAGNAYQWADFNGDGKVDLICTPNTGDLIHWVRLSTGTGLGPPIVFGAIQCMNGNFTWADFNGDGRSDLICNAPNARFVRLSEGNTLAPQIPIDGFAPPNSSSTWADFNGDGMADLLIDQSVPPFGHWVLLSTGTGLLSPITLGNLGDANSSFAWVDLNGDGMVDLVADQNTAPFQHFARYSTGKGLTPTPRLLGQFPPAGPPDGKQLDFRWVDFNNDGLADLICCDVLAPISGRSVLLSNGSQLGNPIPLGNFSRPNPSYAWQDLTGNGMVDLAVVSGSSQAQIFAQYHQGLYPDLAIDIRNGVGGQTRISYQPITASGIYSPDPNFQFHYPFREQLSPIYVVQRKNSNDGRLDLYSYDYTYRYTGSTSDLSGRGWLGFSTIEAVDGQTSVVQRTDYSLPFPRTGIVTRNQTLSPANLLLSQKTYSYITTTPYPNVNSVLRQSETLSYYDSGNQYTTGQTYAYDQYGSVVLTNVQGDLATTHDDYAVCATYLNRTTGNDWLIGFPTERVTAKTCTVAPDGACSCTDVLTRNNYAYSTQGPLTVNSMGYWVNTNNSWLTISYHYDSYGNPIKIVSPPSGEVTVGIEHDYETFESERTNALGQTTRSVYSPQFGIQTSTTDPNGATRSQALDGFGRPITVSVPDPSGHMRIVKEIRRVLKGDISAGGELYTETRSLNGFDATGDDAWRWTRDYKDGLGRTYLTRNSAGLDETHTINKRQEYNNEAQVQQESLAFYQNATPPWVQYKYDLIGRVSLTEYPNGSVTKFTRSIGPDPNDPQLMANKVVSVSAAGTPSARTITRYIDPRGNLVRTVYADQAQAIFGYDLLSRPISTTLPNGAVSTVVYDSVNRQVRVSNTDSGTTATEYDDKGRLAKQTNGDGKWTSYEYDAVGRPVLATLSTGQVITYTYDQPSHGSGIGRLTTATVHHGSTTDSITTYTYDALGHVTSKTVTMDQFNWTETTAYDPSGRPTGTTYPDGTVSTTTYQPNGFMSGLTYGHGSGPPLYSVDYSAYTALGKPQTIRYRRGDTTVFTTTASYFNDGRIETQDFESASAALARNSYSWTPLRQIDTITDVLSGKPAWKYHYGPQGYLLTAQGPLPPISFSYTYDLAGNVTSINNLQLQYTSQRLVSGSSDQGTITADYTGAGQLKSFTEGSSTSRYSYDALGKLRQVQAPLANTSFNYDSNGLRIKKVEPGVTTIYPFGDVDLTLLSDGRSLLTKYVGGEFGAALAVTEGSSTGAATNSGGLQPGPNGPGVPVPGSYFFLRTFDGSTAVVGDTQGQIVTVLKYDPYGKVQVATSSGKDETRSKYLGAELDHSTGLYALTQRYMDPRFGRFITPDTSIVGGPDYSAASFNRYAYGGDDPINTQDPSGEFFLIDDLIEAIVVAEIAADVAAAAAEAAASAAEIAANVAAVTAGTYIGGAAVNGNLNPGKWKWGSPTTYIGIFTGGFFGAFGGDIAEAIAGAVGGGFTGGLVGAAAEAGFENAVYATESNPNPANIAESFFLGAVQGAAFHALGEGASIAFAKREQNLLKPDEIEMRDFTNRPPRSDSELATENAGGEPSFEKNSSGSCSLSLGSGTLIETDRGLAAIESLALGDYVLASDTTGQPRAFMVVGTGSRNSAVVVQLRFGGEEILATPEHPFFVEGRGWTRADAISAGDHLRQLDGASVEVESAQTLAKPTRVYSIQIAQAEHFAATPRAVLAHNISYNLANCRWGYNSRVEQVDVDVSPADIGTGSATNNATRQFARAMGLPNDDAGHVIARMLGGSGTNTSNIFPQNLSVNRGVFARWERVIRRDIQAQNATANLRVVFHYATATSTRPYQIDYEYTLLGTTTAYPGGFGNP